MQGARGKLCKVCNNQGRLDRDGKCTRCMADEEDATCPVCDNMVGDGDKGLQCDECQRWYHVQCEGVDEAWYGKMQDEEGEPWYCRKCMRNLKKYIEKVKRFREERETWTSERVRLEDQIKNLTESLGVVERENRTLREELKEEKSRAQVERLVAGPKEERR